MKKTVFVMILLLIVAGFVCAQEDMTFQHFYENLQFIVTTVPYGMISNPTVRTSSEIDELSSLDTDNDGFVIVRISETQYTLMFDMINIDSKQSVFIAISSQSNYPSTIDQRKTKVYNFANANQRTAFLNEIKAVKTRLEANTSAAKALREEKIRKEKAEPEKSITTKPDPIPPKKEEEPDDEYDFRGVANTVDRSEKTAPAPEKPKP